ncbi:hypothetical protein L484_003516 [Morus notabilis]|uniref:Uncharacterized protein n=1 Tax=Morus notabilis TaxID=981085 RepID=W9SAQ4_9ROSA|nr:hypothetical protein L484_003516 [Morus notabilis]
MLSHPCCEKQISPLHSRKEEIEDLLWPGRSVLEDTLICFSPPEAPHSTLRPQETRALSSTIEPDGS